MLGLIVDVLIVALVFLNLFLLMRDFDSLKKKEKGDE